MNLLKNKDYINIIKCMSWYDMGLTRSEVLKIYSDALFGLSIDAPQ
jgi:hypothetical protein